MRAHSAAAGGLRIWLQRTACGSSGAGAAPVSKFSAKWGDVRADESILVEIVIVVPGGCFSMLKHLASIRSFALNFETASS